MLDMLYYKQLHVPFVKTYRYSSINLVLNILIHIYIYHLLTVLWYKSNNGSVFDWHCFMDLRM